MQDALLFTPNQKVKLIKPALAMDFKPETGMYDYAKPSRVFTKVGTNMSTATDDNYRTRFNFASDDTGYLSTGYQGNNVASGFYYTPDSPELRLTGDFTVEAHAMINQVASAHGNLGILLAKGVYSSYYGNRFYLQDGSDPTFQKMLAGTMHNSGTNSTMTYVAMPAAINPIPAAPFYNDPSLTVPYGPSGKMFHIAFTRKGNVMYIFINGVLQYTLVGGAAVATWGNNAFPLILGNYAHDNIINSPSGFGCFGGRIKRLRIYQQCLYTKNFVPSTKAYNVSSDGDLVTIA